MANVMNKFDATMMTSGTGTTEEETQKFLGALIPAVLSAAPSIINALRPRRKALDLTGESEAGTTEEETQKFLGAPDSSSSFGSAFDYQRTASPAQSVRSHG